MSDIANRLAIIRNRMEAAAHRSGRDIHSIQLVAVTKFQPIQAIRQAIDAGVTAIGENRPQELRDKHPLLDPRVVRHFIGTLQSNKIKYVVPVATYIHSVDSVKLVQEINQFAQKCGKIQNILLEINVSGEDSKHGLNVDQTVTTIEQVASLANVHVCGLMTMAPLAAPECEIRQVFRGLKVLANQIQAQHIKGVDMDMLSMGMTQDFEIAIEEGSTCVRVGTGIFGQRN